MNGQSGWFHRFARATARITGRAGAFMLALLIVITWAVTGPLFGFSDTWQLVINTATTIATFLMVFLIQHTQNRDAEAMQLKLSELIRATDGAKNDFADLEGLSDEQLQRLEKRYVALAERARDEKRRKHPHLTLEQSDEREEAEAAAQGTGTHGAQGNTPHDAGDGKGSRRRRSDWQTGEKRGGPSR
jgi:low affinity Fe/Cu permease